MSANPKRQVTLLALSTILSLFSLASVINFTDPVGASFWTFGFFYGSLFLTALGSLTLLGLGLRQWLWPGHYLSNFSHSLRQGLLIGILIVISFILLAQKLLFWWVELSIILFLAAIEIFLNLKI